ncbi:hypothetical protein A3E49_03590 [Candidatus Saccharibacteria bacterium RIFCSPHIGHO2_12_FULL_49_19]|nr:MAG: hypothetical protein A2708_02620 [Candidatus Saccharibacteria bacterium RIFCSPHIGHO2_01_FULL_49_21]OGL36226.1 MAG: hypothetical protein A3E49_03590 [Candidatus Saccharibacteria bacterium RIFCSPHIGHO2_12_FULL_49_19]OGL37326.1 MAG: hypothetical protein A3B63_02115 [Candidatus Saccharibacteria bacterium RIFCSPLOWO2_01_FULL_49_22]
MSLARELKKANKACRVVYIGLRGEKVEELSSRYEVFDEAYTIAAGKFRRYHGESFLRQLLDIRTLLLNIRDFFKVSAGVFSARRLLGRIKPDVVFSKGGFVVVPVGIAARWRKVPIITHDSDVTAGLANRILARWAVVRTSGQQSAAGDSRFVGIPVGERLKPVTDSSQRGFKRLIGIPSRAELLLIAGGGLGARDINERMVSIMPRLLMNNPNLYVVHITGSQNEKEVRDAYQISAEDAHRLTVIGFSNEFDKYSAAADLIVSRAGATALAEFAAQHKAVLLIPATHLASGHQLENARDLQKRRAVKVLDNEVPTQKLFNTVDDLLNNKTALRDLGTNLGKLANPSAAADLAKIILDVAYRYKKN